MSASLDKKGLELFGARLRKIRVAKGLSLRQMSDLCKIDNSKIAKMEKGKINFTLSTFLQLAEALQISPSELIGSEFVQPMKS